MRPLVPGHIFPQAFCGCFIGIQALARGTIIGIVFYDVRVLIPFQR